MVTVRTYWAWETTATLRLFGDARGARAGGGEGRGISCRHAHSLFKEQRTVVFVYVVYCTTFTSVEKVLRSGCVCVCLHVSGITQRVMEFDEICWMARGLTFGTRQRFQNGTSVTG